ncbi:Ada metal-binding domain-containing protein [Dyadobacter sp. CY343]|uniref:Ada metal-binding domain-containing protein n=1 Tax=Dyadobacter sp. CY343 TaxID=2907299 RepID=UPI001F1DE4AB|nr:Ada metal-binding domain-containing protein [Dyadobacter sp. CY343]MCE7060394.1 metal-binding protein [Dyadobacter sp. CY343]
MITHSQIGTESFATSRKLYRLIADGAIAFGGNKKLKIYGLLNCKSGKRMKQRNRVFFQSEQDAIRNGYRPCGHCMRDKYLDWKNSGRFTDSQTSP